MKHVVVVGAGAAGTAAALAARAAGARVTVVHAHAGATALAPGAIDGVAGDATAIVDELGLHLVKESPALVATTAGTLRAAVGCDRALLDFAVLRGVVLVPRIAHASWDARALARAWTEEAFARAPGLTFAELPGTLLRFTEERFLKDADMAARHDDPARLDWLAERVRELVASYGREVAAVVLPPWLGAAEPRAGALAARVGLPCGEAIGLPGGPSGLRFEHARDAALDRAGVELVRAFVTKVDRCTVRDASGRVLAEADAVVLAIGGLVGGGLSYTPGAAMRGGDLPPRGTPSVHLTLDAPVAIGAQGRELGVPGSMHGAPPESLAWPTAQGGTPLLERAGILADADGRATDAPGVFAAGEVLADRPRTWLAALASGGRAGAAAAR